MVSFKRFVSSKMSKELLFFYNAKSGNSQAIKDYFHKVFSPSSYSCNLCKVTYGQFGMKKKWKKHIEKLKVRSRFYYKDHLQKFGLNETTELPALFLKDGNQMTELMSAKTLNEIEDLDELIDSTFRLVDKL